MSSGQPLANVIRRFDLRNGIARRIDYPPLYKPGEIGRGDAVVTPGDIQRKRHAATYGRIKFQLAHPVAIADAQ